MERAIKIFAFGVLGLGFCFLVGGISYSYYDYTHREPSELRVHVETLPWKSVTIKTHNSSQVIFQPPDQARLSPIDYGKYWIGLQLTNGQSLWCEYYHMDAGVRRHVDITITSVSDSYRLRLDASGYHDSFELHPETATEQSPFRIPW